MKVFIFILILLFFFDFCYCKFIILEEGSSFELLNKYDNKNFLIKMKLRFLNKGNLDYKNSNDFYNISLYINDEISFSTLTYINKIRDHYCKNGNMKYYNKYLERVSPNCIFIDQNNINITDVIINEDFFDFYKFNDETNSNFFIIVTYQNKNYHINFFQNYYINSIENNTKLILIATFILSQFLFFCFE